MFLVVINKVDFDQNQCTLVSLIDVLAWISVLRGNFLKSNKRPALNKCPGMKNFSEFSVQTSCFLVFFSYFDVSLPQ